MTASAWILLIGILTEWKKDFPNTDIAPYTITFSSMQEENVMVLDVVTGKFRLPHGMCKPWSKQILLRDSFWNDSTIWQKKKVLYHELAHCVLNRDHDNTRPNIMDTNINTPTESNWDSLVKDLQNGKT